MYSKRPKNIVCNDPYKPAISALNCRVSTYIAFRLKAGEQKILIQSLVSRLLSSLLLLLFLSHRSTWNINWIGNGNALNKSRTNRSLTFGFCKTSKTDRAVCWLCAHCWVCIGKCPSCCKTRQRRVWREKRNKLLWLLSITMTWMSLLCWARPPGKSYTRKELCASASQNGRQAGSSALHDLNFSFKDNLHSTTYLCHTLVGPQVVP